ncbi:23S rRNA (guanosine(2251)-2'-O)-methyltransferase RlmB [Aliikangiella coralliicola]|uniref:23S rRNA (guanosine-2'-O-)-methyltransferase RlmB n=1 Tax=Aliikangiella coralliicola TaxID=2592383 RepID=A0A545UBV5_9GAMM|nr:23S rRNA (guanosine(2251)-2'-O)-methyltransferase RlmB [Aliikangiella coralliicola]TQV86944.1 23S rRNA (guanosine(2251)-2'-O)-methyltransferase RlmB [Aliikangiella coralliicola]
MSQNERIFGIHAVESFLEKSPERVIQLFLQKNRHDKKLSHIEKLANNAGLRFQQVDKRKMDDWINGNHQGVIAEVKINDALMNENQLLELAEEKQDLLLLVLDGVTDPHNLGACLRTADASGVDAVVVPKDRSASLTAVARKVACGAAEHVPVVKVTNLSRFLTKLKQQNVWVIGTAGEATSDLYQTQFSGATALVMGAEGSGMRRLTREQCDQLIKIPMSGSVSSLNVSVATGVCLFEIVRQRSR